MRLFIAEKPSLARAIAAVLGEPQQKKKNHIICQGGREIIAWCAGHILSLAPPDAYDAAYKSWRLEHLPIVPALWQHRVVAQELYQTIKALLATADAVVHAGDPDREGQLLVEEVLERIGYTGPVERLLIHDLNPQAVKKALGALQPNAHFRPLYAAALARQRADWLYGLNATRLYTLKAQEGGYEGLLSVGRVQTPLLRLIVDREAQIRAFSPKPYYVVEALLQSEKGPFVATVYKSGCTITREDAGAKPAASGASAGKTFLKKKTKTAKPKNSQKGRPR
jgi:DNA topoisomerase-3